MELELSIEDLLNRRRIESDRIEFKASWNPDDVYHSVCAFANDYDNTGGGYILIGVEEHNGVAVRPVKGIQEYEIDAIKKDMIIMIVSKEKKTVAEGNPPIESEKTACSDGNPPIDRKKSCVSGKNVSIDNEKSCVSDSNATFEHEKSCVSIEKVSFEELLMCMDAKERTRENIRLLKRAITDDVFSRSDIAKLLRISGTAAGNLINKMKENMLIVPVSGRGKGRYRFITEEDETE